MKRVTTSKKVIPHPSEKIKKVFGRWFKILRLKNKLTQTEMAEILEMSSPQYIAQIEAGKYFLPEKNWRRFCFYFKIDIEKFKTMLINFNYKNIEAALSSSEGLEE